MKKILSLVLVLSLVLGSMSMAFAAAPSFSDVENEDVLKAVQRLNAFGIVDGYEDGSYKPENNITRAEFSKLLVTALGLENAAKAASGISHFGDVTGGEWFAGAVNVAAGQGIVKGYADGTYRPDAEVKYSEAVTMLVRALGYKDEFLPGKWPGNFIAQAADVGITDDVTFQPNGIANRGSVAIMLNNALDAKMVKVDSYNKDIFNASNDGIRYGVSDDTLLSDKLGIDKYESVELTETPKVDSGLDADQVAFRETDDSKKNGVGDEDDFKLPSKFDVEDEEMLNTLETRLGESLNVYVDDDEVVFFETADNAYTVKWGTILDGDADKTDDEITVTFVDGDDKTYDYEDSGDDEIKLYIDNEEKDEDDLAAGLFGKFVIADNGDIALADLHNWNEEAVIVTESDAEEFGYVEGEGSTDKFEADDFDKVVVMDTAGNLMKLEDIQKEAVVYINEAELAESGDDVAYVVVVETEAVIETAKDYDIDDADGEYEFKTNEKTYDVSKLGTVSVDQDDDYEMFEDADDELESITGADSKVKILFDIVKNIRHISSDVDVSSSTLFGVIIGIAEDDFHEGDVRLKVKNNAGEKVVYEVDFDEDEFYNVSSTDEEDLATDLAVGDIIKYTLNADGEIDYLIVVNNINGNYSANKLTAKATVDGDDETIITSGDLDEDIDEDSIEFASGFVGTEDDFTVASNVVVFDVTDNDAKDMDVIEFSKIKGNGSGKDILVVANEDEEVELIVVDNEVASDDQYVAYLLDTRQHNGDHYFEMAIFGEKEVQKFEVDESFNGLKVNDIDEESIVVFQKKADNTIKIVAASDSDAVTSQDYSEFEIIKGEVTKISSSWITLKNGEKVKLYSDTLVYEDDDEDQDIDEGDYIVVAKDGTKARVIKLTDAVEDDDTNIATDGTVTYIDNTLATLAIELDGGAGNVSEFSREDGTMTYAVATFLKDFEWLVAGQNVELNVVDGQLQGIKTIALDDTATFTAGGTKTIANNSATNGLTIVGQGSDVNKLDFAAADFTIAADKVTIRDIEIETTGDIDITGDNFTSKDNLLDASDVDVTGDNASFNTEITGNVGVTGSATFTNVVFAAGTNITGTGTVTLVGTTENLVAANISVTTLDAEDAEDADIKAKSTELSGIGEARTELSAAIVDAKALNTAQAAVLTALTANEKTALDAAYTTYNTAVNTTYDDAISAAETVRDNASATKTQLETAKTTLDTATSTLNTAKGVFETAQADLSTAKTELADAVKAAQLVADAESERLDKFTTTEKATINGAGTDYDDYETAVGNYITAVVAANTVLVDAASTETELDTAKSDLASATTTFNTAKTTFNELAAVIATGK